MYHRPHLLPDDHVQGPGKGPTSKTNLCPQIEDLDCSDGLTVTSKPQMMSIKSPPRGPLTVAGTPLHVDEVKYPGEGQARPRWVSPQNASPPAARKRDIAAMWCWNSRRVLRTDRDRRWTPAEGERTWRSPATSELKVPTRGEAQREQMEALCAFPRQRRG